MVQWKYIDLVRWDGNNVPNVDKLEIDYAGLDEIPQKVFTLTTLRTLHCIGNNLTFIPKAIAKLTNLEVFVCSRNKNHIERLF